MSVTTVSNSSVSVPALGVSQVKAEDKGALSTRQDSADPAQDGPVELGEAVAKLQDYAQSVRRNLDFQLDESSGRVVVQVINSDSGELIRQIPSEEALELASRLDEARSLLLQEKA